MKITRNDRSYNIIVVSDATTRSKSFTVSFKLLRNIIIGAVVLLFSFGYVIYDYLTISFNKHEFSQLQEELTTKDRYIEKINTNMQAITVALNEAEEYKKRILVALGLQSPSALEQVGSGGGGEMDPGVARISNQNVDGIQIPRETNLLNQAKKYRQRAEEISDNLQIAVSIHREHKLQLAGMPSIWPTSGYLTDSFGWRNHPLTGKRDFHEGQDIATQLGNKVVATADGTVLVAEYQNMLGNAVYIDHNFGYVTVYGHLAKFAVKAGDMVKRGQVIGYVGSTGASSAPHLHYEVRYQDKSQNPINFIFD
jgi:murein DD-endopeptidase MepM/ murein hydrolase activator NlpD